MSTRSVVGTIDTDSSFRGRYVHSDGYPTGRGPVLAAILARHDGDLEKMLDTLVNKYREGWSYLSAEAECSYDLGANRSSWVPYVGLAYMESGNPDPGDLITGGLDDEEYPGWGVEWGYFFTGTELTTAQLVVVEFDPTCVRARIPIAQLHLMTEAHWVAIECGENFERCPHYAWAHVPGLPCTDGPSMREYLARVS